MIREIPEGSIEIQTGLWLYEHQTTIGGNVYTLRKLYSAEGYCFYDSEAEIYDEEGNLIPDEDVLPNQRTYMQYIALAVNLSSWTYDQLNAKYISVPVQDGYEIVSVPNSNITI